MSHHASRRPSNYFVGTSAGVPCYSNPHISPPLECIVWTDEERSALVKLVQDLAIPDEPTDWSAISSHIRNKTPMDCYIQYENVDNPAINKGSWSYEEEQKLAELVLKYDEHDWCSIAEELGTKRTPMKCLRHYQQHMNTKLINNKEWTAEEDELLKNAVEQYGKGQWQAVSSGVPGRTSAQCMSRYNKTSFHDNTVAGRWIPEEEKLLFLAALAYGAPRLSDSKKSDAELRALYASAGIAVTDPPPAGGRAGAVSNAHAAASNSATSVKASANFSHWQDMAALVPGKNEVQCREKWTNALDPSVSADAYTPEEDNRLIAVIYALQHQHQSVPHTTAETLQALGAAAAGGSVVASSADIITQVAGSSSAAGASGATSSAGRSSGNSNRGVAAFTASVNCIPYGANAELMRGIDSSAVRWVKVAEYVPGRTDASVRSRYNQIIKDMQQKKAGAGASKRLSAAAGSAEDALSGNKRARQHTSRYRITGTVPSDSEEDS